jgi:hypothetical protein
MIETMLILGILALLCMICSIIGLLITGGSVIFIGVAVGGMLLGAIVVIITLTR